MPKEKVSAIVPAFNEEKTVGGVVEALRKVSLIDEIIVVDDGSFDKTSRVAQKAGARVVRMKTNQGKGEALKRGVQKTDAQVLLFTDADLINVKPSHFHQLIEPILKEKADMTVGLIDRENFYKLLRWFLPKIESPFSGMRALRRDFWESIPEKYKTKYFVESALTYFAKKQNLKVQSFVLRGVSHLIKEKKYGFFYGIWARAKMFSQIILVNIFLRLG